MLPVSEVTEIESVVTPEPNLSGLIVGRIVHYVMPSGKHRPAIVVQVWSTQSGMSNLQVFLDGSNDGYSASDGLQWFGSIFHDKDGAPGTWHFIEQVQGVYVTEVREVAGYIHLRDNNGFSLVLEPYQAARLCSALASVPAVNDWLAPYTPVMRDKVADPAIDMAQRIVVVVDKLQCSLEFALSVVIQADAQEGER